MAIAAQKVERTVAKMELSARAAPGRGDRESAFSRVKPSHPTIAAKDTEAASASNWELAHIERARKDPRAFAPLYEVYAKLVWRFALSRLGDPEHAADATSVTFAKAIAALPQFQPEKRGTGTTFRSWLMLIARNVVIDTVRKERVTSDVDDPSVQRWFIDPARPPEEMAIAREEQHRVERALTQLTDVQRQIVELRAVGMKGAEIADLLQMGVPAVRSAYFRAYARLRELLQEPGKDQETQS
jgi:RNA polymerase sigma-70 factor (ECF subfamily)